MDKMYRLEDHNVRAGESPSDFIIQQIDATLSGSAASVTTNFKSGNIGYLLLKKASTNSSGVLSVAAAVPGATADVSVLVFGRSRDLFSSF